MLKLTKRGAWKQPGNNKTITALRFKSYLNLIFIQTFQRKKIVLLHIFFLKSARVIPLFKYGDYNNYNIYRPISILLNFSKLIEKIVLSRLYDYFDKFHLLNDFQSGFRKNHFTYMPLLLL